MKIVFLHIVFLLSLNVFSQSGITFVSEEKVPLKAERFIGVDNYGDVYYIKENTLFKDGRTGTIFFKDFQLGKIGSVDILNPLKITVFYPNHNVVVILDNRLNEIQRIAFSNMPPFINIANATTASENSIWVFNEDAQQLELYQYRNKKHQSLSTPISEKYITQKSNFNFCYILTEEKLRLYNIYGSLLHSIPNESITILSESNNRLLVKNENGFYLYSENLTVAQEISVPEKTIKDLFLINDFLYLYDGEFVHKARLTQTKK